MVRGAGIRVLAIVFVIMSARIVDPTLPQANMEPAKRFRGLGLALIRRLSSSKGPISGSLLVWGRVNPQLLQRNLL